MPALSVFIIARDEADRIGPAIESVKGFAAEVVVVDSGSGDDTVAVAEAAGARVLFNAWQGYGPQKRFAEDACRNPWVFNLDADERATPALADEIARRAADGSLFDTPFWRVRIRDVFPHEDRPAPWAYGYDQIRLYDRRVGRFSDSPVHDTVRPPRSARVGRLEAAMAHRSTRSLAFSVEKMNRYTTMQVEDMVRRGRRVPGWRLVTEFPLAFLKAYVVRRGALYGLWGLAWSTTYAYGRFLRLAKRHEADLLARAGRNRAP